MTNAELLCLTTEVELSLSSAYMFCCISYGKGEIPSEESFAQFQARYVQPLRQRLDEGGSTPIGSLARAGLVSPVRLQDMYLLLAMEYYLRGLNDVKEGRLTRAIRGAVRANMFAGMYARQTMSTDQALSPREAATLLANESKSARDKRTQQFQARFVELGMSKNNAAGVLATEFGIEPTTARKKLQGMDTCALDRGEERLNPRPSAETSITQK